MTTIVYDHSTKTIAYDSRECGHIIYSDNVEKAEVKDGITFILAGESSSIETLMKSYPDVPEYCTGVSGLLIISGVVYDVWVNEGKLERTTCSYSEAHGSGHQWALAAMDFGKSAEEAVEYAKKRDNKTGGKVRVIKLGE